MNLKKASLMLAFSLAAQLAGQRATLLKTAPGSFLFAAIRGAHLSGQRATLLKTAPGSFFMLE
jgi:hypothetical protein